MALAHRDGFICLNWPQTALARLSIKDVKQLLDWIIKVFKLLYSCWSGTYRKSSLNSYLLIFQMKSFYREQSSLYTLAFFDAEFRVLFSIQRLCVSKWVDNNLRWPPWEILKIGRFTFASSGPCVSNPTHHPKDRRRTADPQSSNLCIPRMSI